MTAQKLFGTRDLYEILQVNRSAQIHESNEYMMLVIFFIDFFLFISVKKSYYKLSLAYHPDRVSDNEKEEASSKFCILHNAYSVLSDPEKKQLYDAGSDILFTKTTFSARWEHYLKPLNELDIESARKAYQCSESEEMDVIREFSIGNGSIRHLMNNIPFMRIEDENRIIELIMDLMSLGKIPKKSIKKLPKSKVQ